MDSRLRGNDGGEGGNDGVGVGMTGVRVGMVWVRTGMTGVKTGMTGVRVGMLAATSACGCGRILMERRSGGGRLLLLHGDR